MKPRLRRVGRQWVCTSAGVQGFGPTPIEAFVEWWTLGYCRDQMSRSLA